MRAPVSTMLSVRWSKGGGKQHKFAKFILRLCATSDFALAGHVWPNQAQSHSHVPAVSVTF